MATDFDHLDELLGAYALDALDPDERQLVEDYLSIDPRARAEVQEHREVATLLAWTGSSAPAGIWDRIATSLDERPPAPGPELARIIPMVDARRRRARRVLQLAGAAAAAAVIAVVAVRVGDGGGSPSDAMAAAVEAARSDRDSKVVQLVSADGSTIAEAVIDADGHGYLLGEGLPSLADDRTYQLWGVVDGEVISLGVLGRSPEIEPFTVEGPLTALVVTDEVAGGVAVSEQPAVVVGELA